ncbi:MAG: gamma-glutamylcyclotransferase [Candidatus Bathyarchaeota archaeon]|nr:MAG: gamma-glutamylcyclotransferase [Candidatus Bathyarchaeota archaeon]
MLYFSYGSFLDQETLMRHCPSASFVTKAVLLDFEVQFNFMSKTYEGGVTGVEPAAGKRARGVVYHVPPEEMEHLDTVEGVPQGIYYRQTVTVVDEDGNRLEAETYRTTDPQGPFTPTRRYIGLMIKGAEEHGLDPDYIRELEELRSRQEELPSG